MQSFRLHTKVADSLTERSCNCKRSACRKKYCECFRLKKFCTSDCKCTGCRNKEGSIEEELPTHSSALSIDLENSILQNVDVFKPPTSFTVKVAVQKEPKRKITKPKPTKVTTEKPIEQPQPHQPVRVGNIINEDFVESTIQSMFAQAEECIASGLNAWQTERMIINEFDNCLVNIVNSMGATTKLITDDIQSC